MTITLTIEDRVALLKLDRPEVHNVIDERTMSDWERCQREIDIENPTVIILTGEGEQTFCAGGDLKYFAGLKDMSAVAQMSRRMQALLNRMYEGPRPVIAAVNGSAYGGGCEILTACHLRIAADHARFQFRQSAMGVVTGWGGGTRLLRELGKGQALKLLLTGKAIDAGRAYAMGLVHHVSPKEEMMAEARAWADMIATRAPDAVHAFLELARYHDTHSLQETRKLETDRFISLWQGPWFQDAMQTFLSKNEEKAE